MTIIFKIERDIIGRAAAQLNWKINELSCSFYIENIDKRRINGKSLIGLLSGKLQKGQTVKFLLSETYEEKWLKEYFEDYGEILSTEEGR